jgi:hypothetical protein
MSCASFTRRFESPLGDRPDTWVENSSLKHRLVNIDRSQQECLPSGSMDESPLIVTRAADDADPSHPYGLGLRDDGRFDADKR